MLSSWRRHNAHCRAKSLHFYIFILFWVNQGGQSNRGTRCFKKEVFNGFLCFQFGLRPNSLNYIVIILRSRFATGFIHEHCCPLHHEITRMKFGLLFLSLQIQMSDYKDAFEFRGADWCLDKNDGLVTQLHCACAETGPPRWWPTDWYTYVNKPVRYTL